MVNNTWILIYKKLNNTATPEELEEIDQILKEDGGSQYPIAMLEHLWRLYPISKGCDNEPKEERWAQLQSQLNNRPDAYVEDEYRAETIQSMHRGRLNYILIAAAAVILFCSSIALIYFRSTDKKTGSVRLRYQWGELQIYNYPMAVRLS
ncbi:hypothetical protein ACRQ5D_32925 [Mucilaginibacter sp. P25]|uniref:hypothetical protein n=1 Tax=unclassified Mucilaginibacter TaxID=2617802 RepID=UPI003D67454F